MSLLSLGTITTAIVAAAALLLTLGRRTKIKLGRRRTVTIGQDNEGEVGDIFQRKIGKDDDPNYSQDR
jgi:hypothetical protein